jgi:hypothetical protein
MTAHILTPFHQAVPWQKGIISYPIVGESIGFLIFLYFFEECSMMKTAAALNRQIQCRCLLVYQFNTIS